MWVCDRHNLSHHCHDNRLSPSPQPSPIRRERELPPSGLLPKCLRASFASPVPPVIKGEDGPLSPAGHSSAVALRVPPRVCRGESPFPEGLGVSPNYPTTCHCEPFSEHRKEKAKQSPLPEIAASLSAPRKDRLGQNGGSRGLKRGMCNSLIRGEHGGFRVRHGMTFRLIMPPRHPCFRSQRQRNPRTGGACAACSTQCLSVILISAAVF